MFRQIQMWKNKFFFFLFFYFLNNNSFASSSQVKDTVLVSSSENVFIKYSVNAKVSATIRSKIYFQYDNGDAEFPSDIDINVFDNKHELLMTIHANEAYRFDKKNLWLLRGDVEVFSFDSKKRRRQVNTELLYWDQDKEIIYNGHFVRIESDDFYATGNNFFARQNFSYYKMDKIDCTFYTDRDNL